MSTILPLRSDEAMTFTIAILDLLAAGGRGFGAHHTDLLARYQSFSPVLWLR
jgi:hypothetical protein